MSNTDILALVIAFGGWIVAIFATVYQIKQSRDQKNWESVFEIEREKLRRIHEHLDAYSELLEIYRMYARQTEHLVNDAAETFSVDEHGQYIVEKTNLEPEERFEMALRGMTETDLRGAIAQKIVSIRLNNGKIGDLLTEIDQSDALTIKMGKLFIRTVNESESAIASNDFLEVVNALNEADRMRTEMRTIVNDYFNAKFSKRS
jgi:hypothetical protein